MLILFEILSLFLVAVAMALSLAHVLEWPGKLRLAEGEYLAVQPIYYPGFTFAGGAEPLGILALIALLFLTPTGGAFWLVAGALLALAAAHATYWLMTHPVNNFWLKNTKLGGAGSKFFKSDPLRRGGETKPADWRTMRDRWERSHAVRAVLTLVSFLLLSAAVAS